jgi:FAD synthetase
MKRVMCFGTFDLLHLGHLNYFKQAKQHGQILIVVIARDKTKQNKTVFTEQERQELIQSLDLVDEAVLGYLDNHFKIIKEKKPDIICLGYDHPITETELSEKLLKLRLYPKIIRAKAYKPENQKSSKIKNLILENS